MISFSNLKHAKHRVVTPAMTKTLAIQSRGEEDN